jgi:hypothetical protein
MRSFRNMKLAAAVVCVLISGCATEELGSPTVVSDGAVMKNPGLAVAGKDQGRDATAIELDKSLHFTKPDGNDVVAPAGRYQVESTVDAQLRLVPEGGTPPLSLAASSSINGVDVTEPVAVVLSSGGDDHIVLLLPGGTTLDAIGSTSGVGTRGPNFLPKDAIGNAVNAKGLYKSSAIQDKVQQTKKTGPVLAVQFTVQPAQQVSGYQACDVIAGFGYVSSLKTEQTRITPPGMGTPSPVTTQPRSGYLRIVPRNPYRCAIGSVTVTPTRGTLHAGDHVQLLVAGFVFTSGYPYMGGYWVEDTYDLTASGNGPLTFSKVVMAATFVGDDPQNFQREIEKTVSESPKGSPVGAEAMMNGESAGKVPCVYTPVPNGYGAGTVLCATNLPYPVTGR